MQAARRKSPFLAPVELQCLLELAQAHWDIPPGARYFDADVRLLEYFGMGGYYSTDGKNNGIIAGTSYGDHAELHESFVEKDKAAVLLDDCAPRVHRLPNKRGNDTRMANGMQAINPSTCALAQAFHEGHLDIRLLSLGTGTNPRWLDVQDGDWGIAQWGLNLVMGVPRAKE